jgi:hypothetical protein
MLVALCTLNHAPFEEIVRTYELSDAECIRLLARLDRLKFLELLPGNRYRLLVSRAFSWIPDGPIHRLFKQRACQDFFRANFDREHELLVLVNGRLSKASIAAVLARLRRAAAEFAELRIDDARLPVEERRAITLLIAARSWEPDFVRQFRRARRAATGAAATARATARGAAAR